MNELECNDTSPTLIAIYRKVRQIEHLLLSGIVSGSTGESGAEPFDFVNSINEEFGGSYTDPNPNTNQLIPAINEEFNS